MKLTIEQIQQIENYLTATKLEYIDIRIEVLDHIISDIEDTMDSENISFDKAYKKSTRKWHPQLKMSSSSFTGVQHERPKIVIQKINKIFLKWFLLLLAGVIVPLVLNTSLESVINSDFHYTINMLVLALVIILNTVLLIWYFKMKKARIKSTFLFLFEKQVLPTSLLLSLFIVLNMYGKSEVLEITSLSFIALMLIMVFFGFRLFKKHQELIQNYTIPK